MLRGPGLLVSLPAQELQRFAPSGSLFTIDELKDSAISEELRLALRLAQEVCVPKKARLLLVARPEIFTHGVTLAWLRTRLNGIRDHLCISDGSAVRPIAQMRNHLFLYKPSDATDADAFRRLYRWVPELFSTFESQVNTCVGFPVNGKVIRPPTVLLQADATRAPDATRCWTYVHQSSLDRSVARTLKSMAATASDPSRGDEVIYVPTTEAALHDKAFKNRVMAAIAAAYAGSSRLVLRIPTLHAAASLEDRLKAPLHMVHEAGSPPSRRAPVMFVAGEPTFQTLNELGKTVDLLMPSAYEFWNHPAEFYARFRNVQVAGANRPGSDLQAVRELQRTAFGRDASVRRA